MVTPECNYSNYWYVQKVTVIPGGMAVVDICINNMNRGVSVHAGT